MARKPEGELKKGWTTGACACAAATAAYEALLSGAFPDPVSITLPKGQTPAFDLLSSRIDGVVGHAAVIKDAGDDPDVTHGATIRAAVRLLDEGEGLVFKAGPGVGMVTKPGLPIEPGEPAINPGPRKMIRDNMDVVAARHGMDLNAEVTIAIDKGEEIAQKTWNPRLGIVGGLSVLGTTGVVIPFSCSAWIHSIHRGIDVARATGLTHVAGSTGKVSEETVQKTFNLPDEALLDMGDFAGGLLKYLRKHPLPRLTISGGFAKLLKMAQGHLDLHSSRSQVDFEKLAALVEKLGGSDDQVAMAREANTAKQVLDGCPDLPLAEIIGRQARETALATLAGQTRVDILVIDRKGTILAHVGAPDGESADD
ncbi:cobalt-precorrin-5B (C(1))-methyltransferase [Aestuariispira insulae]|uniref:Cobalt-precorrin-5B C(1)-methyltransferase n=1 Tax=Aestuariispira insulae TaxID=1461337 RepID=A0A3D9HE05_9PROT|nr:cobalt-precorrin-5B (C(1))-methyltransferase [Aestuariispira insulae]RED47704.1 cobalt-precorrin-5B (C1)-methyltransferase [Aestuariispira insulae]